MIYIIDTYAWVEYFEGSQAGRILTRLLGHDDHKIITMGCCLAELKAHCLLKGKDFRKALRVVEANSIVLPVLKDAWLAAAEIRHELRKTVNHFGMIDAILVAKQRELGAKIVSGDPHFKGMKNVVYLGAT